MIRRLKLKIVAIILSTLFVVFGSVLAVLNLSVYFNSVHQTEAFMQTVVENDGFVFSPIDRPGNQEPDFEQNLGLNTDSERNPATTNPNQVPPSRPDDEAAVNPGRTSGDIMRASRFFYVKVNSNGEILELNLEMMFDFTEVDAQAYLSEVLDTTKDRGSIGSFSYLTASKPYGQIIVFAERSIELNLIGYLTQTSLWVAIVVCLILAGLAAFFTNWLVAPVETAFISQRRFISDASHELKTPLAIISANIDVLENQIGENQRLNQIRSQSVHMAELVKDLLLIAQSDEAESVVALDKIDLSKTVLSSALEFESPAYETGKQYSFDVVEGISVDGNEKQLKQLVGILLDNAMQYSDAQGQIKLSLTRKSNRALLTVYNTGVGVPKSERQRIFERFYRSDQSRSHQNGGYGIGLSVAQAIVVAHHGKITVSGEYQKWVQFDVTL